VHMSETRSQCFHLNICTVAKTKFMRIQWLFLDWPN
jgi:hypothetical protein